MGASDGGGDEKVQEEPQVSPVPSGVPPDEYTFLLDQFGQVADGGLEIQRKFAGGTGPDSRRCQPSHFRLGIDCEKAPPSPRLRRAGPAEINE